MPAHIQHDLETLISLSNNHPEFNAWNLALVGTGFGGTLESAVGRIRFNQYFSVPLYLGYTTNIVREITEDVTDSEEAYIGADSLWGSGIIFQHSIGTIGVLTGWRSYEEAYRSDFLDSYTEKVFDSQIGSFYFSLVPLINTGEFPIIGLVFSVYEGLIGNNGGKFGDDFSHKLVSHGIGLGAVSIESIDVFYRKQPYNAAAKLKEFGVKANVDAERMAGAAEIGYRSFYDVRMEDELYEGGLYGIFDWTVWKFSRWDIGLRCSFDKLNSPIPAIGMSVRLFSVLSFWGELGSLNEPDFMNNGRVSSGLRLFL
jgi:hypothetical protein